MSNPLEPITTGKFLSGAVQIKTGVKALAFLPWLILWIGLGWGLYVTYIKPHTNPLPTTTQLAEEITNINYNEVDRAFFFGVKLWGWRLGVSK